VDFDAPLRRWRGPREKEKYPMKSAFCLLAIAMSALCAEYPEAAIAAGGIRAKLYLPDPDRGYYRATRFDWSGVISSLEYKGHNYFGPWFDGHDPRRHDSITGPVEEFLGSPGYDEAKPPRGIFYRIGAGAVRKPAEPAYRQYGAYEIVNPGQWVSRPESDRVEFVHELRDESGYAYRYEKTVRLARNRPELTLEHRLRNTGSKPIETDVYDHNFFVIDGQPTGPDLTVTFPFALKTTGDLKNIAKVTGSELGFLRELEPGESVLTEVEGFRPGDYSFRVENRKTGSAVEVSGDQPLSRLVFWSTRRTLCPEPYIHLKIEPGREAKWKITYRFSVAGENARRKRPAS
jgi:hypothetical protein